MKSAVSDLQEGKAPAHVDSTWSEPGQRDITTIEVPEDFSQSVLQESFNVDLPQEKRKAKPIEETQMLFNSDHEYESLVKRFNTLMDEAQSILEVFTGAGGGPGTGSGSIGYNAAGPGYDYNSNCSTKARKPSRKAAIKQGIKRLRSRRK